MTERDGLPISRRAFLAGSAGAVALGAGWLAASPAGAVNKALSPLVLASDVYASPLPQRFVFAIAKGPNFASGAPAQVAFAPPHSKQATVLDTTLYKDGLPKGRGIYVVDTVFATAGVWKGLVLTKGKRVPFAVEVKKAAEAPVVGTAAPRVASPTPTNTLGVKPICTRVPACQFHTVSLADVIGQGPVAALFATPALCQSQYCGPVLDELIDVMGTYTKITPVHIEIYTSNTGATKAPTVESWNLPSEPWLFTIDATGTIIGRLDGAIGKAEIVNALDVLARVA